MEVGQAKLQEAARWRKEIGNERIEMERLYSTRTRRLVEQEECLMSRVREQQRDLEAAAFTHRQRLLQDDARLRSWQQVLNLVSHFVLADILRQVTPKNIIFLISI